VTTSWDVAELAHLNEITGLAGQLLTAENPYEVGLQLWGGAMSHPGELAGNVQALWGSLTDWVERKPAEQDLATAEMVRAAHEWLALDLSSRGNVDRYLDYWLHDVCGYAR
jgi:hypothetical protein